MLQADAAVVSSRTIVADVSHHAHADADLLRLGDRHFGRLQHGHIAEKTIAVDDDGGGGFVDHANLRPRVQVAFLQAVAIPRRPADTVAANAAQLGVYQQSWASLLL